MDKNQLNNELYKIWDKISLMLGLNEKEASNNYKKFIDLIIKRRNFNVRQWFQEITKDFKELREKYSNKYNIYSQDKQNINEKISEEKEHDSILNNYWKLCEQKCKKCFNKCSLTQGHKEEHQCFYDHKCKEKCKICSKSQCCKENCDLNCIIPLSHEDAHSCGHYHPCKEFCIYNVAMDAHNCTPVSIEQIIKDIEKKERK